VIQPYGQCRIKVGAIYAGGGGRHSLARPLAAPLLQHQAQFGLNPDLLMDRFTLACSSIRFYAIFPILGLLIYFLYRYVFSTLLVLVVNVSFAINDMNPVQNVQRLLVRSGYKIRVCLRYFLRRA